MANGHGHRWCLLIHALPARPRYLRARIRRLLLECGAAPVKRAVYALPASPKGLDRLRAIAVEIEVAGGSAFVCDASFPDARTEHAVILACNGALNERYRTWIAAAGAMQRGSPPRADRVARMRERLQALRSLDRFQATGGAQALALMVHLERDRTRAPRRRKTGASLKGLTWVTRKGLHVDRLACAWLVLRFIDPAARFRFVASPARPPAGGEIGFDVPGAAITHEEGRCSVEALVRRAGVTDPAVVRITEMVHDIDLKDGRFGHAETAGLEQLLTGLILSHPSDDDRLARGLELFDALHAALGRRPMAPTGGRGTVPGRPPKPSHRGKTSA